MVCLPCQKKAEARKRAMLQQIAQQNPKAAEAYNANISAASNLPNPNKVLPRYEWPKWVPITNTDMKPTTIWNEWYQAFMMNRNR